MERNTNGLEKHLKKKTEQTIEKVDGAIRNLSLNGQNINFNSITDESGVSKTFLYRNPMVRERIEKLRDNQVNKKINQHVGYDKTSKTKDVIIEAKDKKIAVLEAENRKLRRELEQLRGRLYQQI